MLHAHETMSEVEQALAAEFRTEIDGARGRIAAVLDPACPTADFLQALRAELERAQADPESVPYPELTDPDAYWEASVKPQAKALRTSSVAIVEWLEQRVVNTMEVAETDLKQLVEVSAADPGVNRQAARSELETRLRERCSALHHQMAELLEVLPSRDPLAAARAAHEDGLRAAAAADVDGLKAAYLRDAGGDDAHQRFAEQQWSETYADRVAHRMALLAAVSPWRHQELALTGYERAIAEVEALVEAAVTRLQAPLGGMTDLLLARFDEKMAG